MAILPASHLEEKFLQKGSQEERIWKKAGVSGVEGHRVEEGETGGISPIRELCGRENL